MVRSPVKKMLSYKEKNIYNQSFTGMNNYSMNNNSINNSSNSMQNNFKVFCRFRPINELEISRTNNKSCVEVTSKKDLLITADTCLAIKQNYTFDQVFDENSTGEDIYNITTKNLVIDVLKGYNCTLMCYGQTSSGKTYTINQISPLVFKEIFEFKKNSFSSNESNYFKVTISYLEIYMEKVNDLINTENKNLNIYENKKKEIIIEGMTAIECENIEQLLEIQRNAEKNRRINSTLMNQYSSRSHCIMIITVHFQDKEKNELKVGKLYLVDLAGSEKTSKTGASGLNLEEAKNINKSLHCLGLIIKTLSDLHSNNNNNNTSFNFNNSLNNYNNNNNNSISHIPYRNSKLTRILSDSLGGNSKTTLILTCSKSEYNQSETISTLRFGERAKKIRTKPKINVELKSESKEELLKQIERMKKELNEQNEKIESMKTFNYQNTLESNNNLNSSRDTMMYEEIINQLKEEIAMLKKRLENYQKNNINNSFNNSENDFEKLSLKENKKSKFNNNSLENKSFD